MCMNLSIKTHVRIEFQILYEYGWINYYNRLYGNCDWKMTMGVYDVVDINVVVFFLYANLIETSL